VEDKCYCLARRVQLSSTSQTGNGAERTCKAMTLPLDSALLLFVWLVFKLTVNCAGHERKHIMPRASVDV
jgi:hypothetical protein